MNQSSRKVRVLLLGDARQVHIARWAEYLQSQNYDVLTMSLESIDRVPGSTRRLYVPRFLPAVVRYPLAVPAVRWSIRRYRPDVVIAHFLPNYGVIASLSGFRPWILSTWGSDIMVLPQRSAFHLARTRWVIGNATYITSDADVMTRRLVELGAEPSRVATFPYGVNRAHFFPSPEVYRGDGPRILSNRKLEPVYDIECVLAAFGIVARRAPAATLTVSGTGNLEPALRAAASSSPGATRIHFIGDVSHASMPDLLRRHDVFVSMARSDTTSVSLLEAMACGLFPIVSDIPANREWIEPGLSGLLVRPGAAEALAEAISLAWGNPTLREDAAARNARVIAARADWFDNMSRLDTLLDRLLGESQSAGDHS